MEPEPMLSRHEYKPRYAPILRQNLTETPFWEKIDRHSFDFGQPPRKPQETRNRLFAWLYWKSVR